MKEANEDGVKLFLAGRSEHAIALFNHFVDVFKTVGPIKVSAAKTMIGVVGPTGRIAWVTQFGKNFIHVVFPFKKPYADNLCFQKIAQVPGDIQQFNHHFRMIAREDINKEVIKYMKQAYKGE